MIQHDELARHLYSEISVLPTVDAHEHLHAEPMRLDRAVDIFLLFHQYLFTQLIAAGMPEAEADALGDETTPLDRKWETLAPYLDHVRDVGCARPAFAALERFFDEDDLTADNYERLTARMRAHNAPGLFTRCLKEACGIVLVLNQNRTMWQNDLFRPILPEDYFLCPEGRAEIEQLAADAGEPMPGTFDHLKEAAGKLLALRRAEGMIGIKGVCFAYLPPDEEAARLAYPKVLLDEATPEQRLAVNATLRHHVYEECGKLGLVVVKHSGVWSGGWADHTNIRPTNLFPEACAHRQTRFDLFHAGTPRPEDAGLMARGLPNVYLNLCWSHLISPTQAAQALDIWLDEVPVNKVFGFGGDYWWAVENVYGNLVMTREIIASVLARRIRDQGMKEDRALRIARLWLHDNPREAYGVHD